jgi:hypothetical protein
MRTFAIKTASIMATLVAGAGVAAADDVEDYWPASEYGMELSAGGGVSTFAGDRMQSNTDAGAMWDVRYVMGTRSPIALEAAYVGTTQGIDSIFGDGPSAALIGTGLEADLRLNLLPMEDFTPFAFGGLGWKRYDVSGADFRTADTGIRDSDTLLEVPMGVGMAFREQGFVLDARFTYRMAAGEDLVIADNENDPIDVDGNAAGMDNWAVGARVGYEF